MSDQSQFDQPEEDGKTRDDAAVDGTEGTLEEEPASHSDKTRRQKREDKTDREKARDAAKAVQKQERVVEKLYAEKDELSKRVKDNRNALQVAEEELEALKSQARKTARLVARQQAEKQGEVLKVRLSRASSSKSAANKSVNTSKEKLESVERSLKAARKVATKARLAMLLKKAKADEAVKTCMELQAQGETVPDEGFKDLSAPGAWKPPGVLASKVRDKAKAELTKATVALEKSEALVSVKEKQQQAVEQRLEQAKAKRKILDEKKRELNTKLAEVVPPVKAKHRQKGTNAKGKAKSKASVKKVLKKPAKVSAKSRK